jgi:hypothetical protein
VNWALTLRLAGEFQGYARDLHDLAVDHFVVHGAGANVALRSTLRNLLTKNRLLDKGNAHPGSLGDDFQRLGLALWPALRIAKSAHAEKWRDKLEALNQARNAIAHAEEGKIAALANAGYPINVRTIRSWKSSLHGLVDSMDSVVSEYLDSLFMTGKPW